MKKSLLALSTLVLLLNTSCQSHEEHEKEEDTAFLVSSPLIKDTVITNDYVCQIHAISHIELRVLEGGYLQNIFIDEGQEVKKGQRLFQIMPLLYQAEQQKAQAEANFAEIEYQNTKRLADSDVVSANELALAKAKYDKAKAELSLANVHLGFTEIKAPFDGIIDKFHARLGSLMEEGDLITNLSDNSQMWVYFNVPEAQYLDFKLRDKGEDMKQVQLRMANGDIFEAPGVVETIEADFNNETGNIAFRATFPNPHRLLRHGETGSILMNTPMKNAMLIPQKATFEILDKNYCFVVDKNNVIHTRQITIGQEMPHIYAVTSGLKESDRILIDGLRKVKNGDKIKADFQDPKILLSNLELYAE